MAAKLKILLQNGSLPQTNIEQLVQLDNKLPAAVQHDENGTYLSSDAAVWQIICDSAPAGASQGKSPFLAVTHYYWLTAHTSN
jgi:hypothetical protein